ncbi:MAG TPA: electron transfer flavoprotein subunit beta/FixA family protein [Acidobacteriota bacterium]|nr:electron transfer flavoprotein subunit beta/FixA family protein [Acidobacteriota bacterium]
MRIIVCLKEVPGRDTRYEVRSDGRWIKDTDVSFEISECDEYALEEALKLQEKHGGEVVLLTLGSERAEKIMRKGLAMGAERGILVLDPANQVTSPLAIATVFAEALKNEQYDLILTGTQSDDLGYAQTGVMLAQMLDVPHATIVMEINVDTSAGHLQALREMESGWFQRLEMSYPAVLTIQAGISQIRFTPLKGILMAKKKEIRRVELNSLNLDLESIPRLEVERVYFPEATRKAEILQGDTETVASMLVEKLRKEAKIL